MTGYLTRTVCLIVILCTLGRKVMSVNQKNVFGNSLRPCSTSPMTGWYRDGYCHTDSKDYGLHTVCATMTKEFLDYTKSKGNDLSSPNAHFPGLKPGDSWCLCAARWAEALRAGVAPKVKLEATNEASLKYGVKIQSLQEHATEKKDIESMDYAVAYENCNSDNSLCEK